ncbi:exosortase-associated EpsI family protein [Acinetobacter baumannii]
MYLNRTDGALIRLTTPVYSGETEQEGDTRLQGFVHDLLPPMTQFLPSPPS